jgi:hypothetical protein
LLAILVEGYMAVKQDTERARGVPEELGDLLAHEVRRAASAGLCASGGFVSDEALHRAIEARLAARARAAAEAVERAGGGSATEPAEHALAHYAAISRSNAAAILLPGGLCLGPPELAATIKSLGIGPAAAAAAGCGGKVAAGDGALEAGRGVAAEVRALDYLEPAVRGLMARYAVAVDVAEEARAREAEGLIRLETVANVARLARRAAAVDAVADADARAKEGSVAAVAAAEAAAEAAVGWRTLRVRVERAQGIPRMDLFKGADAFCTVLVEGHPDVFQTRIVQRTRSGAGFDWVWGDEFTWRLPPPEEDEEESGRSVVMLVYDKDLLSADDVVGCAAVPLAHFFIAPSHPTWR